MGPELPKPREAVGSRRPRPIAVPFWHGSEDEKMKLSMEEACEIAEQSILQSTYKGGLKLSGAKYTEAPTSLWGTPEGGVHGEWKVFFRKVYEDGFFMEPDLIIVMVDAVTGEVAKFPMI